MHTLTIPELLEKYATHPDRGLEEEESIRRLREHGANELKARPRPSWLALLFNQFKNFLIVILLLAAGISVALGEYVDALAIIAIIILNAVLGVIQESRAENALAALKKMAAPHATVIRGGRHRVVPARELVPGDVVALEAGNYIPADVRLLSTVNLKAEEASLTGESLPVEKTAALVLEKDVPLGDRKNTGFMGTLITYGRGTGLVTATGMRTQIGRIAEMLQTGEDEPTPLQRKLSELGRGLGLLSLGVCAVILVLGLIRDTNLPLLFQSGFVRYFDVFRHKLVELFMTAVSLAIAAVPEGLPAVVTVCLALGMRHMVNRHALIRRLPAVETLGCASVICSDKTGTLTQNAMSVVELWCGEKVVSVSGKGYEPKGEFFINKVKTDPRALPDLELLLHGGLLCNDARLEQSETGGVKLVGDPTEGALVTAAGKAGLLKNETELHFARLAEAPFDSDRKRMSTIHEIKEGGGDTARRIGAPLVAFVKGGPDVLLARCTKISVDGNIIELTGDRRARILTHNAAMARRALRVLGVALRPLSRLPEPVEPDTVEHDLVFLGLAGMIDPARPEAAAAVRTAQTAGIKTVMITGDYKDTAAAIAGEIGILERGRVLAGSEIDGLSEEKLAEEVASIDVLARVSPEHKVKIVGALQRCGHVVAMTGDGVNDAPALKKADIGVAMGITGTDVTKETADIVLTDDNYASIVAAIEQGRIIFSNIRKFVTYLLACNVGEILIILTSMLMGLPLPFTALMLLVLNLVTDGPPAIALGLERGDPDIMLRPPRPAKEPVVNRGMALAILLIALADTIAVLCSYLLALDRFPGNLAAARTVAFATLVCSELFRAFIARSEHRPFLQTGFRGNRWLLMAVGGSFLILLALIYVPFLRNILDLNPLSPFDWLLILPFAQIAPVTAELTKIPGRMKLKRPATGSGRASG